MWPISIIILPATSSNNELRDASIIVASCPLISDRAAVNIHINGRHLMISPMCKEHKVLASFVFNCNRVFAHWRTGVFGANGNMRVRQTVAHISQGPSPPSDPGNGCGNLSDAGSKRECFYASTHRIQYCTDDDDDDDDELHAADFLRSACKNSHAQTLES